MILPGKGRAALKAMSQTCANMSRDTVAMNSLFWYIFAVRLTNK